MKSKINLNDRTIKIGLYVVTFLCMAAASVLLSVSYITDETGTVANAAFLAGNSWSDFIGATGGYFYKYGQAFVYYPVVKFISNPFWMYRGLLIVNSIFYALIPVISYEICIKFLHMEEKTKAILFSLIAGTIPGCVIYSTFARADVILIVFSWLLLYCILEAYKSEKSTGKYVFSVLAAFCAVYIYACHTRGIVWIIAVVMMAVLFHLFYKEKIVNYSSFFGGLVVFMVIDKLLATYFKSNIWTGSLAKHGTTESFSFSSLKLMFTGKGLMTMLKACIGWTFNMFTGTMGIAFLGVCISVVLIILVLKRHESVTKEQAIINVYGFLTFAGSFAIGTLFFFRVLFQFETGEKIARADRFVYDRYITSSYGVLILIALFYLFENKELIKQKTKAVVTILSVLCIGAYCVLLAPQLNRVEFSLRNTVASALFIDMERLGNDANSYAKVAQGLLYGSIMALIVLVIVLILSRKKEKNLKTTYIALLFLLMIFTLSIAGNYRKLRYQCDHNVQKKVSASISYISNLPEDIADDYPCVYLEENVARRKPFQMGLKNYAIFMRDSKPAETVKNYIVVGKRTMLDSSLNEDDCYLFSDYSPTSVYVVYVKGEELKAQLEEDGYSFTKIPQGTQSLAVD